jgi:hypothetical protein
MREVICGAKLCMFDLRRGFHRAFQVLRKERKPWRIYPTRGIRFSVNPIAEKPCAGDQGIVFLLENLQN